MNVIYSDMLVKLRNMDEKQLLEMFHDLENIAAVERIADCAYHFVESHEETDWSKWKKANLLSVKELNQLTQEELNKLPKPIIQNGEVIVSFGSEMSEDEENKQADDLQRYRDIKSTNERPY